MMEYSVFVQLGVVQRKDIINGRRGDAARAQSVGPRLCSWGAPARVLR